MNKGASPLAYPPLWRGGLSRCYRKPPSFTGLDQRLPNGVYRPSRRNPPHPPHPTHPTLPTLRRADQRVSRERVEDRLERLPHHRRVRRRHKGFALLLQDQRTGDDQLVKRRVQTGTIKTAIE